MKTIKILTLIIVAVLLVLNTYQAGKIIFSLVCASDGEFSNRSLALPGAGYALITCIFCLIKIKAHALSKVFIFIPLLFGLYLAYGALLLGVSLLAHVFLACGS